MTEATGIFDPRERPHHAAAVAERIWNAFWRHKGMPLATIQDGLDAILKTGGGVPFALVAEIDGRPCGDALVIDNDEPAKPDLTAWLAALWVDQAVRGRGVARALLDDAARRCQPLGVARLYLVSRPACGTSTPVLAGARWKTRSACIAKCFTPANSARYLRRPRRSPPWT